VPARDMSMNDHKARAKAICMSACSSVACRCAEACAGQQFDPLLGAMPAWWDYLPDGGEARRSALAARGPIPAAGDPVDSCQRALSSLTAVNGLCD